MPYADPEVQRLYHAARYAANREKIKAAVALRRLQNLDRIRQQQAEYRKANKAKLKEKDAAHYQATRSKQDAASKAWAALHPESRAQHRRLSKLRHPETNKAYKKRRKARLRGAAVIEVFSDREIFERDGWICGICGEPIVRGEQSIDHILPVSKGGQHTRANVRAAHYICNRNRGNRT